MCFTMQNFGLFGQSVLIQLFHVTEHLVDTDIPMSFMVADHRLVCIRKTLGTVFPLQLSVVEHMFIVLSQ